MIEERFSMAGRRAVVTGGGGGFGRAFCRILAEAGAEVVPVDIDRSAAEETAALVSGAGGRPGRSSATWLMRPLSRRWPDVWRRPGRVWTC